MKRFLFIPSCALLAFGMLTSCQKEEKTAQQLAEELTAELQKVTDYKTAEAVAPRVEALNKRYQNASVRVFSADANALAASDANAYSEAVNALVRELARVQASTPVTAADGEVDDTALVRAVGVGAGAPVDAPAKDQFTKGQLYTYNADSESNNNPPALAEYYGSSKLASALAYVATTEDNGAFKFANEEDVPSIPEAVEVEAETVSAADLAPAEEETAAEEPAAEDEPVATDEEPVADEEEPAVEDEPVADEEPVVEDEPADDAAEEEVSDDAVEEDLGADEEIGGDEDIDIEL